MDQREKLYKEETINGPYKATQLWNDVTHAFRDQVPCGRHRRIMKTFDNCFSGSSAVEWLFNYLKTNKNFKTHLSREKAVSLVNKLYKAGIFEEVKVSKNMQHKPEVQENRLYRFLPISPSKARMVRLPLAPRNDAGVNQYQLEKSSMKMNNSDLKQNKSIQKTKEKVSKAVKQKKAEVNKSQGEETAESHPPCYLITKILTPKEIRETWERVFTHRLKRAFGVKWHGDIIKTDVINGSFIMHNCIYINKNGTVTNIAPEDQFPHWVWSAMKCLARWPEPQEVGLPNYPGFEKDVFAVVRDYFLGLEQSLVPFTLYEAICNVFVLAGNQPSQDINERESVIDSLWTSASLENVIMNLAKKYNLLDGVEEPYEPEMIGSENQISLEYESQDAIKHMHSNESLHKIRCTQNTNVEANVKSLNNVCKEEISSSLPPSSQTFCANFSAGNLKPCSKINSLADRKFGSMPNLKVSKYETAFGPDNHTVTRVYYDNGVCTDYRHCDDEEEAASYSLVETHFDMTSERETQFSRNVNFERIRSLENVTVCKGSINNHLFGGLATGFGRSKSFAGTEFPQERKVRAESQSSLTCSRGNLTSKFVTNPACQENLMIKKSVSGQDQQRDTCRTQSKIEPSQMHGGAKAGEEISTKKLPGKLFDYMPLESQTLPRNHGSPLSKKRDNGSYPIFNRFPTRNDKPVCSPKNVRSRDTTPNGATKSLSVLDLNSPLDSGDTIERISAKKLPGKLFDHMPLESQTLPRNHGSPLSNRRDTGSYPVYNKFHSGNEKPVCSSKNVRSRDTTPIGAIKSSSVLNLYSPLDSGGFGPGYRPVLDASKERKNVSSVNLTSYGQAHLRHIAPYVNRKLKRQVTSTPLTPSCSKLQDVNMGSRQSAFSLSGVTPLYGSHAGAGYGHQDCEYMAYPQTRLSEDRAKNYLQLITLLIPPACRRKLHMLFKMMTKMTANPNLCLDPTQSTRSLVLGTFYSAIVRPQNEEELDDLLVLQLVSFMLDFYDDIFTPPEDLKKQVSHHLKLMQRPQISFSPRHSTSFHFCQQTTVKDYEKEKKAISQRAIEELLENIIKDQKMEPKEKRHRLKQFQKTYPVIYTRRFPNPELEAKVLPPKPKMKDALIAKPLNRLKGLRL